MAGSSGARTGAPPVPVAITPIAVAVARTESALRSYPSYVVP